MKLNNIPVKAPLTTNFIIDTVEYAKIGMTASGRKVKDIIAIKRNFTLNYNGLRFADYNTFFSHYILGEAVPFTYEDNNVEVTAIVYITSVPRGIYQELSNISHSITITLEEV